MLGKILALVLVPAWLLLSAWDAWDRLDVQKQSRFYDATGAPQSGTAPGGHGGADKLLETDQEPGLQWWAGQDRHRAQWQLTARAGPFKVARLHKLHRIFLI